MTASGKRPNHFATAEESPDFPPSHPPPNANRRPPPGGALAPLKPNRWSFTTHPAPFSSHPRPPRRRCRRFSLSINHGPAEVAQPPADPEGERPTAPPPPGIYSSLPRPMKILLRLASDARYSRNAISRSRGSARSAAPTPPPDTFIMRADVVSGFGKTQPDCSPAARALIWLSARNRMIRACVIWCCDIADFFFLSHSPDAIPRSWSGVAPCRRAGEVAPRPPRPNRQQPLLPPQMARSSAATDCSACRHWSRGGCRPFPPRISGFARSW